MRSVLLAVAVLTAAAHAAPDKPAHPDATGDELLELARARIHERAGDLDKAHYFYRQALSRAKRANTYWNMANIERRMENYREAIKSFEQYKQLATTDAERAAADAEIAAIKKIPMRVAISGHDVEDTYVFVDGAKRGLAPVLVEVAPGPRAIDLISASAFDHWKFTAGSATVDRHRQRDRLSYGSGGGNVILAGSGEMASELGWDDGHVRYKFPGRLTLPPGKYETKLGGSDRWMCNTIKFTVPKKGAVFVYVSVPKVDPKECTQGTVTTHVVPL